jgi:hypothetical protein
MSCEFDSLEIKKKKIQLYHIYEVPPSPGPIFTDDPEFLHWSINGNFIKEKDYPHVQKGYSTLRCEKRLKGYKWDKNKVPLSPLKKIYLISGLAGTGKSTEAFSYLNAPIVFTKTNNLKNKYLTEEEYRNRISGASTLASFLRILPVHSPFYELKPHYHGSERDTGREVEDGIPSMVDAMHTFIYNLTGGDKRYLELHRKIPVSMMTDFLRPYYNKVSEFKQRKGVDLSAKITQDLLFDDFGLAGEEEVRCLKRLFEAGAIWSERLAFTYDENQLNYCGLEFIKYLKEHYADRIEEITCYKEWRFKDSTYRWWWFDRFYKAPIIYDFGQASEGAMFVSHNSRYFNKAINTGGWPKKSVTTVDKCQGREYYTIVVGLLGLAALYRNKTPGYKERIYTTITRGKNFIWYVPRGTSREIIDAAIRDVISALSEINRPIPQYDSSILNLKTPRNSKSYFLSYLRRSRLRYYSLRQTAFGGTAKFESKLQYRESNVVTGSVLYRPARFFWPEKPRQTALARLF